MQQPWDLRPIPLKARGVHRIENGQGLSVTALKGSVWITQDRDLRDIILSAGQSFVLDRNGVTLVFAFRDALIMVGQPGRRVTHAGHAAVSRYSAA
ncbi:MAG TPA: DUF2917 domain-containing protein [Hyphomicrobiaceae bacterium]|jgi:hypothetical protein|nr:DUF2917 domain-containing protein [Hyphomicrobiaceae bacterium]